MKFISVSEAALDSIQRMGEADKARIYDLEEALFSASSIFAGLGMTSLSKNFDNIASVSTNVQPIAKSEN